MENPLTQKVEIKHSESKDAWNVIGTNVGSRYKIARIPYLVLKDVDYKDMTNTREKAEALKIAEFIVQSFNKIK